MRKQRGWTAVVILVGALVVPASGAALPGVPRRGDGNGDGAIDVGDVFHLINALFAAGVPVATPCAGDADASGSLDVGDVFFLINHLFAGGAAPGNPVAAVTAPSRACMQATGLVARVPAQAGAIYAWTVDGGTITGGGDTSEVTWSAGAPGTATVACTVTVAACVAAGDASVTVEGPVIASLTADPTTIYLGEASALRFTIAGATSWAVSSSIGNSFSASSGVGSGAFNISYNADNNSGLDTITLTASSACGTTQSTTPIQVCEFAIAITAPASVCASSTGHTAWVADAGAGASYVWGITNGSITAGQGTANITFTAGAAGPVGLSVTVQTAAGCSSTGTASVTVHPGPSITALSIDKNPVPFGDLATITFALADTSAWTITSSLGGSLTPPAGTGNGPKSVIYNADNNTGTDTVTVTAGGPCGTTVLALPVVVCGEPPATITAPASVCASSTGNSASVTPVSGATYAWTVAGGTITAGQGTAAITWSAGTGASASISATVTSAQGCAGSDTHAVTINPLPTVTISASGPTTFCQGGTVVLTAQPSGLSYLWSTGATTQSITVSASGSYTVTGTTPQGCPDTSDPTVVTVNPSPNATITAPASVCANSAGNVASVASAGAGASYVWSITNGVITAGDGTRQITFTAGTTSPVQLTCTVTTLAGCANFGGKNVPINPQPSATITAPASVCASSTGNTASVSDAGAGATYAWAITGGSITAGSGTRQITFTAGASGSVELAVTVTAAGCSDSGNESVTVDPLPTITGLGISSNPVNFGDSATITFTLADTSSWTITSSLGNSLTPPSGSGSGAKSVEYNANNNTGTDTVTVTATGPCGTDIQTLTVNVN